MVQFKTYRKYLLVFLALTIFPMLAMSLLVYSLSEKGIEEQINSNELQTLSDYQGKIDTMLQGVDDISVNQAILHTIYRLTYTDFLSIPVPELYGTMDADASTLIMNPYISSIYIYYKDSDRLLTDRGFRSWSSFQDRNWLDLYHAYQPDPNAEGPVWMGRDITLPGGQDTFVGCSVVRPFPVVGYPKLGYIVINVDANKLFANLITSSQDKYLTLAPDGKIIYNSSQTVVPTDDISFYDKPVVTIGGSPTRVFSISSKYTHWKFVSLVGQKELLAPLEPLKNAIYLILVFTSACVAILCLMVLNILFRPIRTLVKVVRQQQPEEDAGAGKENEFAFIQRSFLQSMEKSRWMESVMGRNSAVIREGILRKLLRGEPHDEGADVERLADICGEKYLVISAEDYIGTASGDKESETGDDALRIALDAAIDGRFKHAIVGMDDYRISCILCLENETAWESVREEIADIGRRFLERAGGDGETHAYAMGIGTLQEGLDGINPSFLDSLNALRYRLFATEGPVLFADDVKGVPNARTYRYPVELESRLLGAIRNGNRKDAEARIDEFMKVIEENRSYPENVALLTHHLRDSMFDVTASLGYSAEEIFMGDFEKLYNRYKYLGNLREVRAYYHEVASKIISGLEGRRKNKNEHVIAAVKKHIVEHIGEDISLNNMADLHNMSVPYLSTIFKQTTGENFTSYVIALKIEFVKKLLTETDMPVSTIFTKVGYANNNGFYKTFRKSTGYTPNEYRNLKKKDE